MKVTQFNTRGIFYKNLCSLCDSSTRLVSKTRVSIEKRTSWENESTMELLGLNSIEAQLRFCPRCFHFFRSPLFDESLIYGARGVEYRKRTYEKYNPEKIYGSEGKLYREAWYTKNKEIFSYLSRIFSHLLKTSPSIELKKCIKILDWGGGDGYLVEAIALVSQKVLQVPCKAYCFDYHEWSNGSPSPYFNYISLDELEKGEQFDLIFFSHVLEHVAFPKELLGRCYKYLTKDGVIVITVPYELHRTLLPKSCFMHYHQQLFSITSMSEMLEACHFRNIATKLYDLSYRGNRMWNIMASASIDGKIKKMKIESYLLDIFNFQNVLYRLIYKKLRLSFNYFFLP